MAHSIESRLPLMDCRLAKFGFRLPGKLGFVTPIAKWFRDHEKDGVYPILRGDRRRNRGLFDT